MRKKLLVQGGKEVKRSQMRNAKAERRKDETIVVKTKKLRQRSAGGFGAKARAGLRKIIAEGRVNR